MRRKYNVLIVDDEFLARKLMSEYVSKIDYLQLVDSFESFALTKVASGKIHQLH